MHPGPRATMPAETFLHPGSAASLWGRRLVSRRGATVARTYTAARGGDVNTDELEGFAERDEPQLSALVLDTARRYRRMPTGAELATVGDGDMTPYP